MEKQKNGIGELLKYEHFNLKIGADAAGMEHFLEAHGQHIQKGLDTLSVEAPGFCLDFKTTFTPGRGAVQSLSCALAGKVYTVTLGDMTPEDWRAFADKLTARKRTMAAKTAVDKHIEKTLRQQRVASEKARLAYEESGDPQIVIGFIKRSPSGAAIKETWVSEAIQNWKRDDREDLFKQAFEPRRGERSKPNTRALENMMFENRIDNHRKAGKTLEGACIAEAQRTGGGNLTGDKLFKKLTALKNKYHRARRIEPEITIEETPESYIESAFPAKIEVLGHAYFGRWQIKHPKNK
ncbi:MAG: hypothetical protein FJ110_00435 [Deltaproteobacteria bacterium]|nr:hypothetical protein [Deltaproteobacteria bacterium]